MDRLSFLPDRIREHILSFLPMEEAVKTGILSSQWRDISGSLSNLDFDQRKFEEAEGKNRKAIDFKDSVNCFLINYNRPQIRSFKLKLPYYANPHITDIHTNAWISFAVKHNVQELHLACLPQLPGRIFTCHTLTVLRLEAVEFHVRSMVSFPNLKRLELGWCKLHGDNFTGNIFSCCPVLEHLILFGNYWYDFNAVIISPQNLKVFEYWNNRIGTFTDIYICTPNLQKITYLGMDLPNISLETLSSLVSACFTLFANHCPDKNLAKILMGLHNVATLRLFGGCLESENLESVLELSKESFDAYLSKHLTGHLMKHIKTIEIEDFQVAAEDELHIVKYLLENATSLKKMKIKYHDKAQKDLKFRMLVAESLLTITKASSHAVIVFS
ncbi:hypothetical protein IFM89_023663 [Coptis chinensis]|uniref:F-box domain-containing protein n=1 Tax=Coptis chinensis TaxID=261450 RepID=A0A835HZG7_9MAGN|nr:hypothetical protein IFM89_023663 [Coptis chinensis]